MRQEANADDGALGRRRPHHHHRRLLSSKTTFPRLPTILDKIRNNAIFPLSQRR